MTDDSLVPDISFPEMPLLPKITREGLVLLAIETEFCPVVLPRILALFSEHSVTAFTINTLRDERVQCIEIEFAASGDRFAALMLQDVLRLRNVRRARFGFPPHDSGLPIAAKL